MKDQSEKSKKSKSKTRNVKRRSNSWIILTVSIFEIAGAIGASIVATMVSPLLIHREEGRVTRPSSFLAFCRN